MEIIEEKETKEQKEERKIKANLFKAVKSNKYKKVKKIAKKLDDAKREEVFNAQDELGYTALVNAACLNNARMFELLQKNGANFDATCRGEDYTVYEFLKAGIEINNITSSKIIKIVKNYEDEKAKAELPVEENAEQVEKTKFSFKKLFAKKEIEQKQEEAELTEEEKQVEIEKKQNEKKQKRAKANSVLKKVGIGAALTLASPLLVVGLVGLAIYAGGDAAVSAIKDSAEKSKIKREAKKAEKLAKKEAEISEKVTENNSEPVVEPVKEEVAVEEATQELKEEASATIENIVNASEETEEEISK